MFWNLEKEKIAVEFAMEKENRVYLKSPLTLENTGDMVSHYLVTWWVDTTEVPSTRIRIFFNPQLCNFFADTAQVHKYPVNLAYESATFWKWIFLIRYESGIVKALNPDISYPVTKQDQAQFFTVNNLFKMATSTHALLPIFPEKSWVLE